MAATPSRRLGLHGPSAGDRADVPSDVVRLRDQLDLVVLAYDQGAALPAAGVRGRQFYCETDRTIYYDTGTVWVPYAWQPGMIQWTAYGGAPPTGWLFANGQLVGRDAYPALFTAISHTFNGGREPATGRFKLPDLRSRMAVGTDMGTGVGFAFAQTGGAQTHTLTTGEMPAHSHQAPNGGTFLLSRGGVATSAAGAAGGSSFQTEQEGGGGAHNNMPPYLAINAWIKY